MQHQEINPSSFLSLPTELRHQIWQEAHMQNCRNPESWWDRPSPRQLAGAPWRQVIHLRAKINNGHVPDFIDTSSPRDGDWPTTAVPNTCTDAREAVRCLAPQLNVSLEGYCDECRRHAWQAVERRRFAHIGPVYPGVEDVSFSIRSLWTMLSHPVDWKEGEMSPLEIFQRTRPFVGSGVKRLAISTDVGTSEVRFTRRRGRSARVPLLSQRPGGQSLMIHYGWNRELRRGLTDLFLSRTADVGVSDVPDDGVVPAVRTGDFETAGKLLDRYAWNYGHYWTKRPDREALRVYRDGRWDILRGGPRGTVGPRSGDCC
jgi:hypothetical protein